MENPFALMLGETSIQIALADTGENYQAFVAEGASPHWEAGDEAGLRGHASWS